MRCYAHRGNFLGKKPELENTRLYIKNALCNGFGAEVDVWYLDGKLYLGHDKPGVEISLEFLINDRIIVHAKDVNTLKYLAKFTNIHSFFQSSDEVSITTWGKFVHHQNSTQVNFGKNDIMVCERYPSDGSAHNSYGVICDDRGYWSSYLLDKKMFRLLILDVDGVMTDGTKTYDYEHNTVSKNFCDRDFTAIKRFQSIMPLSIPVIALTGDLWNHGMCKARNIHYYNSREFSPQLNKSLALSAICKEYNEKEEDIAFIGDDYYDLSLLNSVGHPYCPSDAADIVKRNATVIDRKGGHGVVEGLYELIKDKINNRYPYE